MGLALREILNAVGDQLSPQMVARALTGLKTEERDAKILSLSKRLEANQVEISDFECDKADAEESIKELKGKLETLKGDIRLRLLDNREIVKEMTEIRKGIEKPEDLVDVAQRLTRFETQRREFAKQAPRAHDLLLQPEGFELPLPDTDSSSGLLAAIETKSPRFWASLPQAWINEAVVFANAHAKAEACADQFPEGRVAALENELKRRVDIETRAAKLGRRGAEVVNLGAGAP